MKKSLTIILFLLSLTTYGQFNYNITRFNSNGTNMFIRIEAVGKPVQVEHWFTANEKSCQDSINNTVTWLVAELQVKYNAYVSPPVYSTVATTPTINTDSLAWYVKIKGKQQWQESGKTYTITVDTVQWNNKMWKCLQTHTTNGDINWQPGIANSLWVRVLNTPANVVPDWEAGIAWALNSFCKYDNKKYKCLQAHTSQAGWTPTAVPALWQFVSNL